MKPAPCAIARPGTLPEALALLAEAGDAARIVAGGQSLVPALNMRLLEGPRLIDISRLDALKSVREEGDALRVGALTTHAALARDPLIGRFAPMLAEAAPLIAHAPIRVRGTIGGSLANADPAAELPACAVALGAEIEAEGPDGARRIPAGEFFRGFFETALAPDEILTAVIVPKIRETARHAVRELTRRSGDYAIVGLAAVLDGPETRLVFFGVGDRPVRARGAEAALASGDLEGAQAALEADLSPDPDLNGSPAFKRRLARTLLARTVQQGEPAR